MSYGHDENRRMQSVTSAGKITAYQYENTGKLDTATLPNGTQAKHKYDENGRLTQILHVKGNQVVTGTRYTLADNGQRIRAEEFDSLSTVNGDTASNPAITRDYQYDGAQRLTQEKVADRVGTVTRTISYTYDKVGNRKTKTETTSAGTETTSYTYDANDRLTQEAKTTATGSQVVTTVTWDANGNLKSRATGSSAAFYYWNVDNRLIEVKQGSAEATAAVVAKYLYDADGNRVQKIEGDKTTTYVIDSTFPYAQVVQEMVTQSGVTIVMNYTWGNGLIAQTRGSQTSYAHADGLGSVKVLTEAAGTQTDSYSYDAFGTVENKTGTTVNSYQYTGESTDDTIGLQYNRARWYDASIGRFTGLDPYEGELDAPSSLHRYSYAANDPVNNTDPSGEMSMMDTGAAGNVQGTLSTTAQFTLRQTTQKFLIGDPKRGDFGLIGELIIQEMLGAVVDMEDATKGKGKSNAAKGSIAHGILNQRINILNKWLKGVPFAREIEIAAEVSLDEKGKKSSAKGSLRIDVVVYLKGKAFVIMDMKVGAKGKGNRISNKKWFEYERRFGAVLATIGIQI
jgi:RHS repeat-associated protein